MDKTKILNLVNQARSEEGLSTLVLNADLNQAADQKTAEMQKKGYFAHLNPQNKDISAFLPSTYQYYLLGENLASGYAQEETLIQAWLNSETHRDNILYPAYKDTAISVLNNGKTFLVAQVFGLQQKDFLETWKETRDQEILKTQSVLQIIFLTSVILFLVIGFWALTAKLSRPK